MRKLLAATAAVALFFSPVAWAGQPVSQQDSAGNDATDTTNHAVKVVVVTAPSVVQSGAWNITNITGTISLPTGAATSANQSTEITDLAAISTNTGVGGTLANAINAGVATPGSGVVSQSIQMAGSDGTNARTFKTDTLGDLGQAVSSSGALTAQVQCDSHVFKHITSATDTLLVQGVASKTIKVCGAYAAFAGTAASTVFLENTASANANCSSTLTQITGAWVGNPSSPSSNGFHNALWSGLQNTSGNGLCLNSVGTGAVDVDLWYTQGS